MLRIDPTRLRDFAREHHLRQVVSEHGQHGEQAMQRLWATLTDLYRHVEPDFVSNLWVAVPLSDAQSTFYDLLGGIGNRLQAGASIELLASHVRDNCVLVVEGSSRYSLWPYDVISGRLESVLPHALMYTYVNDEDVLLVGSGNRIPMGRGMTAGSLFAVEVFRELQEALEHYAVRLARESTCDTLREAWDDEDYIYFKPSPEFRLRRSLERHLRSRGIRGVDPLPEQNVDETHPVDIIMSWGELNREALIEVKWLGRCRKDGVPGNECSESAATAGLKQLASYIDARRVRRASTILKGFLVVFDGRRGGFHSKLGPSTMEQLLAFQDSVIEFDAELLKRRDLSPPLRIFLMPNRAKKVGSA